MAATSALVDRRRHARQARQARIVAVAALALFAVFSVIEGAGISPLDLIAAGLISYGSIAPMVTWLADPDRYGLPIYPLHAASFFWAFALPLLGAHEMVLSYPPGLRFGVSVMIAAYLLLSAWVWRRVAAGDIRAPDRILVLRKGMSNPILFLFLVVGMFYEVMLAAGWLPHLGALSSVARAIVSSLFILSVFALGFRSGRGELARAQGWTYVVTVIVYALASCSRLFLIGGLLISAAAIGGYFFGARRVPWAPIVIIGLLFSILHLGKESMRLEHWSYSRNITVSPLQYVDWYTTWVERAVERLGSEDETGQRSSRSLLERASLLHMLLRAVDMTPEPVGYLNGRTYLQVPKVLIPRFVLPNKPASHEATTILSVRYGLQARESSGHTTIGWGLVAEAYANLGIIGVFGLAVTMAYFYAWVARWSKGYPISSARSLFAFLVTFMALNTEYTSTVYASVLFQSTVALLVALLLMRPVPTRRMSLTAAVASR